jgi:hypothetical protein
MNEAMKKAVNKLEHIGTCQNMFIAAMPLCSIIQMRYESRLNTFSSDHVQM